MHAQFNSENKKGRDHLQDTRIGGKIKIFIEILQIYIFDCFDSLIEIKSDSIATAASVCKLNQNNVFGGLEQACKPG
jgi:hypothetical protein